MMIGRRLDSIVNKESGGSPGADAELLSADCGMDGKNAAGGSVVWRWGRKVTGGAIGI